MILDIIKIGVVAALGGLVIAMVGGSKKSDNGGGIVLPDNPLQILPPDTPRVILPPVLPWIDILPWDKLFPETTPAPEPQPFPPTVPAPQPQPRVEDVPQPLPYWWDWMWQQGEYPVSVPRLDVKPGPGPVPDIRFQL